MKESERHQETKLEPLVIVILQQGKIIRRIELEDPRQEFNRVYNEMNRASGRVARVKL